MDAPGKDSAGSAHLDMLRGVAAIAVFLGHLRALMFVDYPDLNHKGLAAAALYAAAGLGHEAVIVFFVLSGFLVGGSVWGRVSDGRFKLRPYANARLARLYSALIPALVLGMALDIIGTRYIGGPVYTPGYAYVVPYTLTNSLNPTVFFGNLGFLQTLTIPTLGTNGPLWSLANEFWYYVAFPCGMVALARGFRPIERVAAGLVAIAVLTLVARPTVPLFGVWLLGAAISALPVRRFPRAAVAVAWAAVIAALAYGRADHSSLKADYALGIATAAVVYFAASCTAKRAAPWYGRTSHFLSKGSYTLYLAHFPAAVLLTAVLLHGERMQLTGRGALLLAVAVMAIGIYCAVLWNIGERHTDWLRARLGKLGAPPAPEPQSHAVVSAPVPADVPDSVNVVT